ncbi:sugar-binding protein, partial [Phytoactinopolyspora endophytica]|uniref:sugar-binding protein n=1 Tax=Phytoactinopolyspora endophytica TaxID=1642495 RepID=UPI00197B7AB1
ETENLTPQADRVYITVGEHPVYLTGTDLTATVSDLATLSVDPGVTGEAIDATLTIDNSGTPRRPLWGTFHLAGTETRVRVAPGRTAEIPITIPAQRHTGDRELVGRLTSRTGRGSTVARLTGSTTIVDPLGLSATHVLAADGSDALRVNVTNHASDPAEVGDISWSAGDTDGTAVLDEPIPSGETRTVDVSLAELGSGTHEYSLEVDTAEHGTLSANGSVKIVNAGEFTPSTQQTITVDGTLDELSSAHTVNLATDGTVKMDDYAGADDLSGTVAVTWDDENLYLSAEITDDTHAQDAPETAGIWAGDSIQLSAQAGTPGEAGSWYQYGLALRGEDVLVHKWSSTDGSTGSVVDADAAINRSGTTTTYEIALPWDTHLAPIDPDHGMLAFSMLVNDNDEGSRKGYIEWGSGIGSGQNAALFNPIRLEPAP